MAINKINEMIAEQQQQQPMQAPEFTEEQIAYLQMLAQQDGIQPQEVENIAEEQDQQEFMVPENAPQYSPEELQLYQQYLQAMQQQGGQPTEVDMQMESQVQHEQIEEMAEETANYKNKVDEILDRETSMDVNITEDQKGNVDSEFLNQRLRDEISKRIEVQSKNAELEAMVRYQQNLIDKQSDKQFGYIDKQKELESELRRLQGNSIPEGLSKIAECFSLYNEHKTPLHKRALVNEMLGFLQNMSGVSGEDYLQKMFSAEYKDVPMPDTYVAPTVNLPGKDSRPQFMSF